MVWAISWHWMSGARTLKLRQQRRRRRRRRQCATPTSKSAWSIARARDKAWPTLSVTHRVCVCASRMAYGRRLGRSRRTPQRVFDVCECSAQVRDWIGILVSDLLHRNFTGAGFFDCSWFSLQLKALNLWMNTDFSYLLSLISLTRVMTCLRDYERSIFMFSTIVTAYLRTWLLLDNTELVILVLLRGNLFIDLLDWRRFWIFDIWSSVSFDLHNTYISVGL